VIPSTTNQTILFRNDAQGKSITAKLDSYFPKVHRLPKKQTKAIRA
jgi:hypothetical protein